VLPTGPTLVPVAIVPSAQVTDEAGARDAAEILSLEREAGTAAPYEAGVLLDAGNTAETGTPLIGGDAQLAASDAQAVSDAAQDATAPDAGPAVDAAAACSLDGSFAGEVVLDVEWQGTTLAGIIPVIAAGKGQLRILVRLDAQDVTGVPGWTLSACSGSLPEFAASWLIGEVYEAQIPVTSWDKPSMPSWSVSVDLDCRAPGCGLRTGPILATLGADAEKWPGRTGPLAQVKSIDIDADGEAGLTLFMKGPTLQSPSGKPYSEPPISWTLGPRASKLFVAYQLATRVEAKFGSCDEFSGTLREGKVEARALGCEAHREGETKPFACSRSQAEFLDENLPNWIVTGGTVRARRVAPKAACSVVRPVWP
jgi:hypothetical protein